MSEERLMEGKGYLAVIKLWVTKECNSYWHQDRIKDIFSYSSVRTREWNRMLVVGINIYAHFLKKYCWHDLELPSQLECGSSQLLCWNHPSKKRTHVLRGNKNPQGESGSSCASRILDTQVPLYQCPVWTSSSWMLIWGFFLPSQFTLEVETL